jgi:rare lipoprotein A
MCFIFFCFLKANLNLENLKPSMKKIILSLLLLTLCSITASETQKGTASYYGQNYTGRLTSSGERFHRDSLTAAHKTFKFGTLLKVVNLKNDSVRYVKINDRLPKSSRHLIDLSYGAAKQLNFIRSGITTVSIQIVGSLPIKK